jgi:lipopolysaccharide/colanic/teichoic acid biosynthesis glycosyltransferase
LAKETVCHPARFDGLWQVSGKNRTTFVEMIRLDIRYAKGKTLWWDLQIILLTVPVLAMQMLQARQTRKSFRQKVRASAD